MRRLGRLHTIVWALDALSALATTTAALSGQTFKAPGSTGGYLLVRSREGTGRMIRGSIMPHRILFIEDMSPSLRGSRLASPSITRLAPDAKTGRAACIRSRSCFRPRATNATIASSARPNLTSASPRRPISNALSDGKSLDSPSFRAGAGAPPVGPSLARALERRAMPSIREAKQ